jgi:hypothetical protein
MFIVHCIDSHKLDNVLGISMWDILQPRGILGTRIS